MTAPDRDHFLAVANRLADAARPIILRHYRRGVAVDQKPDDSPVTVADRDSEAAMRQIIGETFPDHGMLGEEYGEDRADAEYVWVLDPIDGTKSFITGKPLFGTLIALCERGVPVVGLIDMPALGERWSGADDRPAMFDGKPVRTRACADLSVAIPYATSPLMFRGDDEASFARLTAATRPPMFGADCYAYAIVAAGWADIVVEAQLKPYDYCACVAVVNAAGGVAVDWQGKPLGLHSGSRVLVGGDPRLINPALDRLCGA